MSPIDSLQGVVGLDTIVGKHPFLRQLDFARDTEQPRCLLDKPRLFW